MASRFAECGCLYCTDTQRMVDDEGNPFKELRICFPAPVRLRLDDGSAVVAIMQDVDGPVRMGSGKLAHSLESATTEAYKMLGRMRPNTDEARKPGTLLWTVNMQGVSVTYANLDVARMSAFTACRFPTTFPSTCVDSKPIDQIVESGMFGSKVERLLKKEFRPSHLAHAKRKEPSDAMRRPGKKSMVSRAATANEKEDDDEPDDDEKDRPPARIPSLPPASSEWTSRLLETFLIQNRAKAPVLKAIDDVVLPPNGFGNPRLKVTLEHPKTRESIQLFVSSTVLHVVPAYASKLALFNQRHGNQLWAIG